MQNERTNSQKSTLEAFEADFSVVNYHHNRESAEPIRAQAEQVLFPLNNTMRTATEAFYAHQRNIVPAQKSGGIKNAIRSMFTKKRVTADPLIEWRSNDEKLRQEMELAKKAVADVAINAVLSQADEMERKNIDDRSSLKAGKDSILHFKRVSLKILKLGQEVATIDVDMSGDFAKVEVEGISFEYSHNVQGSKDHKIRFQNGGGRGFLDVSAGYISGLPPNAGRNGAEEQVVELCAPGNGEILDVRDYLRLDTNHEWLKKMHVTIFPLADKRCIVRMHPDCPADMTIELS